VATTLAKVQSMKQDSGDYTCAVDRFTWQHGSVFYLTVRTWAWVLAVWPLHWQWITLWSSTLATTHAQLEVSPRLLSLFIY
jgi:hypothetical protein